MLDYFGWFENNVQSLKENMTMNQQVDTIKNECTCDDWKNNIEKINGPMQLQQLRYGKAYPKDYLIFFKFCPWCGSKLSGNI